MIRIDTLLGMLLAACLLAAAGKQSVAATRMPAALEAAGLKGTRMLLQVHDELVFEAPEREVEKALKTVTHVMEGAVMPAVPLAVPLKVDAKAADNWEAAH